MNAYITAMTIPEFFAIYAFIGSLFWGAFILITSDTHAQDLDESIIALVGWVIAWPLFIAWGAFVVALVCIGASVRLLK